MRVHVLGVRRWVQLRHAHPLRVHRRQLRAQGIDVRVFHSPAARGIDDCDVLLFMEANYRDLLPEGRRSRAHALEFLHAFFSRFRRVVWFDDADSAGTLRTYVMPLVDQYAKMQILKDRSYYNADHWLGVPHRDYVHETYQIEDARLFKGPVGEEGLKKLRLGWNLSQVDWGCLGSSRYRRIARMYAPSHRNRVAVTPPDLHRRKMHATCRVGMHRRWPTIHWWRDQAVARLSRFAASHPQYNIANTDHLRLPEYYGEMRNSVVVLSPFGMGEICYRDFEAFMCGALLLKPRMDCVETWPDLYVDGETYVAYAWDHSDFDARLEEVLSNPQKYEHIAREGQRRFVESLTNGEAFADHFARMLTVPRIERRHVAPVPVGI